MARISPNPYFTGQSVMADVPGGNPILDMFQQAVAQSPVYDPDAEAIQMALAERERIMAERGQSAPTYLPQGQTQGSLASVPHTAGYAGPTRASDLLFRMAQTPIMRTAEQQVLRAQGGGQAGQLMDLATAMKGLPGEAQMGMVERAFPGSITNLLRERQKPKELSLEERALRELGGRQAGKKPGETFPELGGLTDNELRIAGGVRSKDDTAKPFKAPSKAEIQVLQNTYDKIYRSTPGNKKVKMAAAKAAARRMALERGYDVEVDEGAIFDDVVRPVAPTGIKVIREK